MRNANIQEILVTRARTQFSHRINFDNIKLGNVALMCKWCEQNCTGLWREENYHALYFQFEESRDATMFMLRWGSADGNKLK